MSIQEHMAEVMDMMDKAPQRGDVFQAQCAPQIMAQIYFGRSVPAGRNEIVDTHSFETFLSESVTPHFPGFTVQECVGYWKGKRELCYVLLILLEDTSANRQSVRTIAEHYKTRFAQEAVGVAFVPANWAMVTWPNGPVGTYHRPGLGY